MQAVSNLARGTYGLRIEGLVNPIGLLSNVPETWPLLTIVQETGDLGRGERPVGAIRIREHDAHMWLADDTRFAMTRDPLTLRIVSSRPMTDEALLHPYLALPAATASWWLGRQVLHGAAFAHRGQAWGILGDREAGKSSTLAALVHAGAAPLSDDLLVVEELTLFAGPAHIDLREDASRVLGGSYIGTVGNRERWRMRHDSISVALPLGGFVVLDWGSSIQIQTVGVHERLPYLARSSELALGPATGRSLLELLTLPLWRAARPRDYEAISAFAATLLGAIDQVCARNQAP